MIFSYGITDVNPHVELNIDKPEIIFGITQIEEYLFSTLEIPNKGFTTVEGEAKLPLIRHMVEIPQNAIPELFITSVSWEYLSLNDLDLPIRIKPVQFSVVKTSQESEFIINEEYYSTNDFMQTDIARIVETGEIRGHLFALVEISPVQYNLC